MRNYLFLALAAMILVCGIGGNANAQTRKELKEAGFVPATGDASKYYVFVPAPNTLPYTDIYVGTDVKVIRGKGEGPQLAPVKVWVGGIPVNPAYKGVFLSPATGDGGATYQYLRIHWDAKMLPVDAQGPGFGREDAEDWYDVDGNAFSQYYVPKTSTGAYVTSGYTLVVFSSQDVRTAALKSDAYKTVTEKNTKAKADEKPGTPKDDKKADPKDDKKADPKDDKKVDPKDDKKVDPKEGKKD